jgi:hypothetical protein
MQPATTTPTMKIGTEACNIITSRKSDPAQLDGRDHREGDGDGLRDQAR